ncbi:N-acetylneuraminate synthase [Thalassotalea piscium]|uniref:N-acetylneuraminate synthase n=1 Tax=Thalassotalea piscium TaxID=1230533 RepID=A0A7X0NJQ4_9GAMM|nr:N-acetylneuraminate synthase [Thalassotalea piscium]MBB6544707.1 N-acetylneuraminate synthase [Thalassotalea piscium]
MTTLIIAEAGVNHNGDEKLAYQLVDAAVAAGVDIVKFQTFKAKNLVTQHAQQAQYQQTNTNKEQSQYQLLKQLELTFESHKSVKNYCDQKGIEYLSTAFDSESLRFLVDEMQLKRLKIPSGELTNSPFILEHALTGCDLIVSTGMATLVEIRQALGVIAYGYLHSEKRIPTSQNLSAEDFSQAFASKEGQQLLLDKVVLLHCTTEYPAPFNEVNLNVLDTLDTTFKLTVGYSDHTQGIIIPIAAVAKGAQVIEKHFTLSRALEGPDHQASIEPDELIAMVEAIRVTEKALGSVIKKPSLSELKNRDIVRKSLVAIVPIAKGDVLSQENVGIMRPGNGISPTNYWRVLGKTSKKTFNSGDLIEFDDL